MIQKLVDVMGTQFCTPEYVIMREGAHGNEMYYVQNGDCFVNIRDHNMNQ